MTPMLGSAALWRAELPADDAGAAREREERLERDGFGFTRALVAQDLERAEAIAELMRAAGDKPLEHDRLAREHHLRPVHAGYGADGYQCGAWRIIVSHHAGRAPAARFAVSVQRNPRGIIVKPPPPPPPRSSEPDLDAEYRATL